MPNPQKLPPVCEDLKIKKEASLLCYLITDGRISFSAINEINKDKAWLFKKLKIKDKKELKNIILAIYDEENNKIITHLKTK